MDQATELAVRERAGHRREYCQFPETFAELPFNLDHVTARKHGGETTLENLALACCFCNRFKGPNLSGIDPETRAVALLFHPRRDIWQEHFGWDGARFLGRTATARATIHTLRLNRADAVAVRELLLAEDVYPRSRSWFRLADSHK